MGSRIAILFCLLLSSVAKSQPVIYGNWIVNNPTAPSTYSHPSEGDEFVGPFTSWLNVEDYGADGSDAVDDTEAFEDALTALQDENRLKTTLYIPAGHYRVSSYLYIYKTMNIRIVGEDPATTFIDWYGASNAGAMLWFNGLAYSSIGRLTIDGRGIAQHGITQSMDGDWANNYFDTGNEYFDIKFQNFPYGNGLRGGALGHGFAETAILRCSFTNCNVGLALLDFNALDIWVRDCEFTNNWLGVANIDYIDTTTLVIGNGAGNFKVTHCNFYGSKFADVAIKNTGEISVRDSYSSGSARFYYALGGGNPSSATLQGNMVLDCTTGYAVEVNNQGPLTLLDNTFRSTIGYAGDVISFIQPSSTIMLLGNIFTAPGTNGFRVPVYVQDQSYLIDYDEQTMSDKNFVVDRSTLLSLAANDLPPTPPNLNRTIYEVTDESEIQAKINQADTENRGNRPIVHVPYRKTYNITSTITFPKYSDVQLVGDNDGDRFPTYLKWKGNTTSPVFVINAPSKVTLRDFSVKCDTVDGGVTIQRALEGIRIDSANQTNARIYGHFLETHVSKYNIRIDTISETKVLLEHTNNSQARQAGFRVTGVPTGNGKVIVYSASGSDTKMYVDISGGKMLIRDLWNETSQPEKYFAIVRGDADLTIEGSHISAVVDDQDTTQLMAHDFSGNFTLLTNYIENRLKLYGNNSGSDVMVMGTVSQDPYIINNSTTSGTAYIYNHRVRPHLGSSSTGRTNSPVVATESERSKIEEMIQFARETRSEVLTPTANGVSDIRMFRVLVNGAEDAGIRLKNN